MVVSRGSAEKMLDEAVELEAYPRFGGKSN